VKLTSQQQLETTQRKLRELEQLYAERQNEPVVNKVTRELTLRSLKRAINKLTEEVIRYQVSKTSA
jgi:hypothetical protein